MSVDLQRVIEARSHGRLQRVLGLQAFWVLAAALLAAVIRSLATESFATPQNLFNVTRNFAFVAIVAIGMTAVIITGGIDLSVGSMMGLAAVVLGAAWRDGGRVLRDAGAFGCVTEHEIDAAVARHAVLVGAGRALFAARDDEQLLLGNALLGDREAPGLRAARHARIQRASGSPHAHSAGMRPRSRANAGAARSAAEGHMVMPVPIAMMSPPIQSQPTRGLTYA